MNLYCTLWYDKTKYCLLSAATMKSSKCLHFNSETNVLQQCNGNRATWFSDI